MPQRTTWCVAFLLLLYVTVTRADAQTVASSFEQLQVLVSHGDTITVRDSSGIETTGRIDRLTPASLTLMTPSGARELRESDVTSIRQRRADSLKNGAIIGLVSGLGAAVTLAAVSGALNDGEDLSAGDVTAALAIYGGLGAAIGVGVDALIVGRPVIYDKARTSGVTISPVMAWGRRGAMISFGF